MGFPRKLLADHEELVLDLRPHWVALVWPAAQAVLIVVATVAALVYTPDDWPDWVTWATLGIALVLLIAYPARLIVGWLTSHFVVTTDRVINREGWIARRAMEMPLERINDVRFRQSIFERMIGAGDLVIESAGEHGQNRFTDIRNPESVQKTIYEMSERNEQRRTAPQYDPREALRDTERLTGYRTTESVSTEVSRPPSIDEQLERLADLRDRGVIDEAEFREAKERVLGDEPAD